MKYILCALLFISNIGLSQDCDSRVTYFEKLDAPDLRPVIVEMLQFRATTALSFDCKRRLDYLLAICYEVTGRIDSAEFFYGTAVEAATAERVDSNMAQISLLTAGFYSRRGNLPKARKLLTEAEIVTKRLVKNYQGFDSDKGGTNLVNPYDEISVFNKSAEKIQQELSPSQLEVLRMFYQTSGNFDLLSNNPEEAKKKLIRSYEFAKANQLDSTEGNILNNIGLILINEANYQRAAEFLHEALLIGEKQNDAASMITVLMNLSSCYFKTKKIKEAEEFARRATELSKNKGFVARFSRASIFLGKALSEKGNIQEALTVLRTSIDTATKYQLKDELAYNYRQLADIELKNGTDIKPALEHAAKSRDYTLQIGDSAFLGSTDLTLGKYFLQAGKYKEALEFTKQSLTFNYAFKEYSELDMVYQQLAEIYTAMGDFKNANLNLKKYEEIKDSLLNREMQLSLQDLERKYESKSKALTISKLEQESQQKELELRKSRERARIFIGLIIAAVAATTLFLYFNRKLSRQKKEIEASNLQLSELNSLQNRLFRIISHDLKSMILPFNRAGKIMNHYLTRHETEQANKYANKLEENAVRLSGTLNNLLYWSSQQLEGYVVKPEQIEVSALVDEIIALFEELIRLKNITINNSVPASDRLYTDREALHVIIRNLLSNALKYTENGAIHFRSIVAPGQYIIEVADEGKGMDTKQVESLISGNLQESKSGTLGEKGSGLGFSIIKKLSIAIKANYQISSEKEKGTTVSIIFNNLGG